MTLILFHFMYMKKISPSLQFLVLEFYMQIQLSILSKPNVSNKDRIKNVFNSDVSFLEIFNSEEQPVIIGKVFTVNMWSTLIMYVFKIMQIPYLL